MSDRQRNNPVRFWRAGVAFGAIALVACYVVCQSADAATLSVDGGETLPGAVSLGEWNMDGDFEGWNPSFVDNAAVSGGLLSGESLADGSFPDAWDPMFSSPGDLGLVIGNEPGQFDRIQFHLQMGEGSPVVRTELFIFTPQGHSSFVWTPDSHATIVDGNPHVYTVTFDEGDAEWGRTVGSFRLDPVADNPDQAETFSYDFLRVGNTAIPEPSTIVLLIVGAAGLVAFRLRIRKS
jgi:hypothetical protein